MTIRTNIAESCPAWLAQLASLTLLAALLASLGLSLLAGPALAKDTTVTALAIDGDATRTSFESELTSATGFTATVLPDPYRVIIDMENVEFDLPSGAGRKPEGLISQVRYGVVSKGKSRIVIDTLQPVLIESSSIVPGRGKAKPRIRLQLVATTPDVFEAAQAQDNATPAPAAPEVAAPEAAPIETASLPAVPTATPPAAAPDQPHKPIIVLDAGHGGIDPGALSPHNTKEKDVVLAFARALRDALNARGSYDVRLTREQDQFISLQQRVKFARDNKADLFIAIHADTVRGQTVRGTTLYTVSDKASDAEAEALAQKENRADIIAGIDLGAQNEEVTDILIDLAQRESKNHAVMFSRTALDKLHGVTEMTSKPLRAAGFVVLKAPDVPSVLIELGYLSSREDEARLKSADWQKRMAKAMTQAVDDHFSATLAAASP